LSHRTISFLFPRSKRGCLPFPSELSLFSLLWSDVPLFPFRWLFIIYRVSCPVNVHLPPSFALTRSFLFNFFMSPPHPFPPVKLPPPCFFCVALIFPRNCSLLMGRPRYAFRGGVNRIGWKMAHSGSVSFDLTITWPRLSTMKVLVIGGIESWPALFTRPRRL